MADTRRLGVNIIRDQALTKAPPSDRYRSVTAPPSAHIPALEVLKIEMQRLQPQHRLALITQYCPACGAHKETEVCQCE